MSLPSELLKDFDEVLNKRGYQSRSKGIRDALKDYIIRYKWMNEIEGEGIGILSVNCDYQKIGVIKNLSDIQQEYQEYINSVLHIHMNEKHFEIIVLKGNAKNILNITDKLNTLQGVENTKLVITI